MFPAFHGVFQFQLESNLPRSGTGNYKMTDLIFKINKTKQNKKASEIGRREASRHVAMVAKFLGLNKP